MIRRTLFGLLVAVVAVGALVSNAAASAIPVKQEIETQLKTIQSSPEFKVLKTFKVKTVGEAKQVIPKIDAIKAIYTRAAAAVAQSSATTSTEKTGKHDWVTAVRLNVTGIGNLVTGLRDFVKGDKAAAQVEIDKGVKRGASANEESLKAYKLLGIPSSY